MRILFATRNEDKIREIRSILKNLPVEISTASDFPDLPEIIEDGATCAENALKKAREVCRFTGLSALADDSGIFVEALGGAPGVYSSRFAGPDCSYADNNRKLLRKLNGIPKKKRDAYFLCIAALATPDGREFTSEGKLHGKITTESRGENGFGYDPVFELPDGRTVAQISPEEKNRISHRAKAFRAMRRVIEGLIEENGK